MPYGLDQTNTYHIRDLPSGAEMAQMRVDARHAAMAMVVTPGVAVAQGGAKLWSSATSCGASGCRRVEVGCS